MVVRVDNSVNTKIKKASFPFLKTLEEYDFTYQPKVDGKLIRELATLNFLYQAKNIVFIGPPGVSKTHLAVAFGLIAARALKKGQILNRRSSDQRAGFVRSLQHPFSSFVNSVQDRSSDHR